MNISIRSIRSSKSSRSFRNIRCADEKQSTQEMLDIELKELKDDFDFLVTNFEYLSRQTESDCLTALEKTKELREQLQHITGGIVDIVTDAVSE